MFSFSVIEANGTFSFNLSIKASVDNFASERDSASKRSIALCSYYYHPISEALIANQHFLWFENHH